MNSQFVEKIIQSCAVPNVCNMVIVASRKSLDEWANRMTDVGFDVQRRRLGDDFIATLGSAKVIFKYLSGDHHRQVLGYRPSFVYVDRCADVSWDAWNYLKHRVEKGKIMKY